MEIIFKDLVLSTQSELLSALKSGEQKAPCMLVSNAQSGGFGSRGNAWQSDEGNLFLSFALGVDALSDDLELCSASIYFAFLMAENLRQKGSKVWLKWPNDFYVGEKKIGGVITTKSGENLVCGIGINLCFAPEYAGILDINIDKIELIKNYEKYLENLPKWNEILSKLLLEFQKSKKFSVHIEGKLVSMEKAIFQSDGSIIINGKKVYSSR